MYQSLRILHPAGLSGGTAYYRMLGPASLLKLKGYHQFHLSMKVLTDEELDLLNPQSCVWQSQYTLDQIEAMERYRAKKPNLFMVYELNDNLWDIPDQNVFKKDIPFDIKNRLIRIFNCMNRIACSNEVLTNQVKKTFGIKNVVTVPNSLPDEMYRIFDSRSGFERLKSDKPRIGWAGGVAHQGDLAVISDLVNRTLGKYQWVFFGSLPPNVDPQKVEFHPPVDFNQYLFSLYYLNIEIGLAPLENHPFNDSKSNLRIIEYTAAGITAVASNIGPYKDQPCVKVNDPSEWEEEIDYALENRSGLFKAQKDYIIKNHTSENLMDKWNDAWGPSTHTPKETDFNEDVVIVSNQSDAFQETGLMVYSTLEEAHIKNPNSGILWIDHSTWMSQDFLKKAISIIKDSSVKVGSVCSLSNRGDFLSFPEMYKINILNQQEAEAVIDGLKEYEGNPYLSIPQPSGPVVLMSNQALCTVGLPHINEFPPEIAFAEWGAAIKVCGMDNMVVLSEYAYTLNITPFSKELMDAGIKRLQMVYPEKKQHYEEWSKKYDEYIKKRQQIEISMHKSLPTYPKQENKTYADWVKWFDSPDRGVVRDYCRRSEARMSRFGIVIPVYKPDLKLLRETFSSIAIQPYENYHVAVVIDEKYENASVELKEFIDEFSDIKSPFTFEYNTENQGIVGASNKCLEILKDKNIDWVFFLDNEDTIPIHCFTTLNDFINKNPKAELFYTDSDLISIEGERNNPFFKPDFDYTRLLAQNYFNHLTLYKYKNIEKLGFLSSKYEGAQDYDLILRYIEKYAPIEGACIDQDRIVHISRVLYHWRSSEGSVAANVGNKPWAIEAGINAVRDHLVRMKQISYVGTHPAISHHILSRPLIDESVQDLVSIIIPFKDKVDFLEKCLTSILSKTLYKNYEILLVNNGSKEKRTKRFLESIRDPRIHVIDYPFEFNYSSINNAAVREAKGSYLVFLNNDTEVLEPSWLSDMLGYAIQKHVGFVGAKLLYGNGTLQHIGVFVTPVTAYHYDRFKPLSSSGYYGIDQLSHESIAVTGACMMIQKDKFMELGMFDPQFKVCYGDVDLCMEAFQKGYTNVVCMTSILFHHESTTRGSMEIGDQNYRSMMGELALLKNKRKLYDPYTNPNFDMVKGFESVVWPPAPFDWDKHPKDRKWAVSINASSEEAAQVWNKNYKILDFEFYGPVAKLNNPDLKNFKPWDAFGDWKSFIFFIESFGYEKTFFFGIRNSYSEILRFMEKKMKNISNRTSRVEMICPRRTGKTDNDENCNNISLGDRDICASCIERNGSPYGFVDIEKWRKDWIALDDFIKEEATRGESL